MSTQENPSIGTHPDVAEMRARHDLIAQSPTSQLVDGLIVLVGLYVAISPWIIGFNGLSSLSTSNLVTGLVVVLLGLGFAPAYGRATDASWVCPLLGVWTIVSLWIVQGPTLTLGPILSNVIGGAVVVLLGLGALGMGFMGRSATHA